MPDFPYTTSFWAPEAVAAEHPLGGREVSADVGIIGGGFAGMSCAYYLKRARPDLDVVLLEAEHIGFGPSGRNFGAVVPGVRELRTALGGELDLEEERFATRWYMSGREAFEQRIAEGGIECEYRNEPIMMQALDDEAWAAQKREAELLDAKGVPYKLLDTADVRRAMSLPYAVVGGLVRTAWRAVQPFKLARGFGEQLRSMGVALYEGSRATEIIDDGSAATIRTAGGGVVRALKAVLATNAYTDLLPAFAGMIFPRHTHVIASTPLADDVYRSLGFDEYKFVEDTGLTFYYARVYKGRLLFGGGASTKGLFAPSSVDRAADADAAEFERVHAEIVRRFPQLEGVAIDAAWGGPVDMTENFAPMIKPLEGRPNIVACLGFNGEGLLGASLSGKMALGPVLGPEHADADAERVRRYLLRS